MERHPTQAELINSAIRTVEEILGPELRTQWARASAGQLVGLLKYTLARQGTDSLTRQEGELRATLAALYAEQPALGEVAAEAPVAATLDGLLTASGALLAWADGREGEEADAVRATLRPLSMRHVAEDLAEAGPLLQGFMTRARGVDVE